VVKKMENLPTPENSVELKYAHLRPDVWKALGKLKRTGWVDRNVKNPESVQEHTITLRNIAASLDCFSSEAKSHLLDMLEIHDWPEAIHGDEVILSSDEKELQSLKKIKFENEKKALESICKPLGNKGEEIMSLWLRFESSSDEVSTFARQLDKYQAIEKAFEFEREQKIPLFKEFLDHSKKYIIHPVLIEKLKCLEEEY